MNSRSTAWLLCFQHHGSSHSSTVDEIEQCFWPPGCANCLDAIVTHFSKATRFRGRAGIPTDH